MDPDAVRDREGTYQQYLGGDMRNERTDHGLNVHVRFLWDAYLLPLCLKIRATSVLCLTYH